ncbi:MAG: hypothetical protein LBI14_02970 [Treponema sp.]|jgi:hypothetical protein|nr:hypothetical protein [Treponema sp.]
MNDIEPIKESISTNALAKQGVAAVAEIAGGILLLIMHIFSARLLPLGVIFALIIGGIGISGLVSKEKEGKKPGTILTIAGALKLLFHVGPTVIKPFAGALLNITSLGLLAIGIVNGIKFLWGLKKRNEG